MYKILGADGKEYGPAGVDEVKSWITAKRAGPRTQARLEGSEDWKPLSEFAEFQEALASVGTGAPAPGPPPPVPIAGRLQPGSPQPTSNGLAVISLVLGILSMTLCTILAGVPAVITGHIARNRWRHEPQRYGGEGMAMAGLIMGYVSFALIPIIAVLVALMLPALSQAKSKAQRISCVSNLKQIGLAARLYANDHEGTFPADFAGMSEFLSSPKILVCPSDTDTVPASDWPTFGPRHLSYEYLTPGVVEEDTDPQAVMFQCTIHNNVALVDGSVQMLDP